VAASMPPFSALKEKRGSSGEGRRLGGRSRVVGAPATKEEGGRQGGWDGSMQRHPTGVVARSCLTGGRRRLAGSSGSKGFLGQTVMLGRADRVGQNQNKSFSKFI
jgi:hypothetical protein